AEVIVVLLIACIVFLLIRGLVLFIKNPKEFMKKIPKKLLVIVYILLTIYLVFQLMWGFHYNRKTFAEVSGLTVENILVEELSELARYLTSSANDLRVQVMESEDGTMMLSHDIPTMFKRASLGYDKTADIYPELGGQYSVPKGVFLSHYWSYTGIAGMYFPFTAEANVNITLPRYMLPSTIAHEMAHQRGFAREDEANYIAYLTCKNHPDLDFQYSGIMLALSYTMSTLHQYSIEIWEEIRSEFGEGVIRDLKGWQAYRNYYKGSIKDITTDINDLYLKANKQKDGIGSYDRMVELMLADFRSQKIE
ncbi:MAG TPA: DUF3810 domain-containing protein, partial [Clostridiales bacterium]|nr:DUF3810 domain-containing protein [Clostridiales bacterium]